MAAFLAGLAVGGSFGIVFMALLQIGRDVEEEADHDSK